MRTIPVIIFFICCYASSAQTNVYHPFPGNGASWNYIQQEPCHILLVYHSYSFELNGDTSIGTNIYHKLNIPYVITWSQETGCRDFFRGTGYQGGIREDTSSKKVYYILPFDSIEALLYDFSLQVGDSVQGYLAQWCWGVVTAIDSAECFGGWRKRWHYETDNGPKEIIEGIGNVTNGLLDIYCTMVGSHQSAFSCFAENNQSVYPNPNGLCRIIDNIPSYQFSDQEVELKIYPNPAGNQLTVSSSQAISTLEIYNAIGEKVYSSAPGSLAEQILVHCASLPLGIYFVKVIAEEKTLFGKFIKE